MSQCPLCGTSEVFEYCRDQRRSYLQCKCCALVFVDSQFHVSAHREKAEYDKHQNTPHDPHYQKFLSRIVNPASERLATGDCVLDFGCGPGPAIELLLERLDISVCNYDLYYCKDDFLLTRQYHAVFATEVIEHLRNPAATLQQIWQCVAPGGIFAAMSKLVIDAEAFATWHYKNDPTHICFYSQTTLHWLAVQWQAEFVQVASDAFIFKKPIA